MEYANKAHSMLARNLDIPFESYCITERPYELSDDITPIAPLIDDVRGWWNKLFLFSNKNNEVGNFSGLLSITCLSNSNELPGRDTMFIPDGFVVLTHLE